MSTNQALSSNRSPFACNFSRSPKSKIPCSIAQMKSDEFEQLLSLDDDDIDLPEAALIIAQDEYPGLDIEPYLCQIDEFAAEIAGRLETNGNAESMISTINTHLFKDLGFRGNMDDYYDPRNSLLNDVLDRRRGIPISLSILYLGIGRRLGLDLEGVSFPGHFLVSLNVGSGSIILDPFFGGISLSEDELEFRLSRLGEFELVDSLQDFLEPASNKSILERMLRNLCSIYMQNETHDKALNASNKIMSLAPDNPQDYRLRATIYQAMECHTLALDDYRRFLFMDPESDHVEQVRANIIKLQSAVRFLH